jgi:hypothetical protein
MAACSPIDNPASTIPPQPAKLTTIHTGISTAKSVYKLTQHEVGLRHSHPLIIQDHTYGFAVVQEGTESEANEVTV